MLLLFLYTTKSETSKMLTTYDMPQKRWSLSLTFNQTQTMKSSSYIFIFLYPFVCQLLGAFVTYANILLNSFINYAFARQTCKI